MDSDDIIVIEDTPPSSPIKQKPITSRKISQENMYYQSEDHEFPVAEQAMIWSRNTTNFIKQSMTSAVQQNNRMPLLHNQNKSIPYMNHFSAMQQSFMPNNGYQYNGIRNLPKPPYTIYNHPFNTQFYPLNGFSSIENLNNFWMKVKLEELPDKGEIVSQYYLDESQTPVRINNNVNEIIMPEFIDINALSYKDTDIPSLKTSASLNSTTEIDEKKRKNPVPLFLKRNRTVNNNNKMKETDLNGTSVKDDTDDVIYIGEFKRTDKIDPLEQEIHNSIPIVENISSKKEDIEHSEIEQKSFKFGKRKRKDRTLIPLRRNPKRQVQIEKDFLKMIDDVIMVSEKEERQKKNMNFKQNKPVKSTIKSSCRRSPRNLSFNGAVYNPPSPLTNAHIRDWPVEGMHERPEYDPVSGKLFPFDHLIRNISKQYISQNNKQQNIPDHAIKYDIPALESTEEPKCFPDLCHEMLHHVMAYVASVKIMEKETNNTVEEREKLNFLELLNLHKNNEKLENKVCDILHSAVHDVTSKDVDMLWENNKEFTLADLLKNNIIIYCLANNIDKSEVAKYIASVKPEDIIKLSNEQFKIF